MFDAIYYNLDIIIPIFLVLLVLVVGLINMLAFLQTCHQRSEAARRGWITRRARQER